MTSEILVNIGPRESRAALLENGVLHEIFIERASRRGIVGNSRSIDACTRSINAGSSVNNIACADSSCSACENRSIATQSGSVVPSHSTRISDGPAIMSMPTVPNTRRLAAAT